MKHNNHSLRIWNLIGRYAQGWNLANWNLYSEQVVNFTINHGTFHGTISMQEVTSVVSLYYGQIAVALQTKDACFPILSFHRPFDVAEYISQLGVSECESEPVKGYRAPQDNTVCGAAN